MAGSGTAQLRDRDDLLLRVEHLVVEFPAIRRLRDVQSGRRQKVHAVSDVSFDVAEGETLGLVGESGCGKSTTGRAIMQLPRPTRGSVRFRDRELTALRGEDLRQARPELQLIFQDPISSLNPRRPIHDIVAEPLAIQGRMDNARHRVNDVLGTVGLDPDAGDRRPHQLSGGQCQRVSIARALIQDPKLLICDEPVSALDVSVQAQILNLLEDMKARYGLTMVFISHDLAVVKNISDRVAVMYLGKLCEIGPAEDLYRTPLHPYTNALLASIPAVDHRGRPQAPDGWERVKVNANLGGNGNGAAASARLAGELPSPLDPPSGCRFRTRCPRAQDICAGEEPQMRALRPGHFVACHFPVIDGSVVDETPTRQ